MTRPVAATSSGGALSEALALCGRHFRFVLLFSALVNLGYLAPTLYMLAVYDMVVPSSSNLTLLFFTLALCATLAVIVALDRLRSRILASASLRLDKVFTTRIYRRAMRAASPQRSAVAAMVRQVDQIRSVVTGPAALAFMDAPWTPIYIGACYLLHPLIGGMAFVGCAILLALALWNERVTRNAMGRAQDATVSSFASQEAASANADVIRSLGMTDAAVSQFELDRQRAAAPQMQAADATGGIGAAIRLLRLLFQSGSLGLAAYLAIHREISPGAIFASSMLASRALAPIDQIVAQWRSVSVALTAYRAVREALVADEAPSQILLPTPKADVSLQRVNVASPDRTRVLLRDVTLTLSAGEVVGVIGASGAGKTTLLQVIANARIPEQGEVRIDGARYTDWAPERLGRHIGYLPQDSGLLPGSIRDNISRFDSLLSDDAATIDADVVEASKRAGAHELILGLPTGYDTVLGAGGRGLSAGQKQRVALARALYGKPRLFVFDEPNAHLDGEGEQVLGRVMADLRKRGALVIVAAQRLNLIAVADKVIVLQAGKVERFGPAREVLDSLRQPPQPPRPPPTGGVPAIESADSE